MQTSGTRSPIFLSQRGIIISGATKLQGLLVREKSEPGLSISHQIVAEGGFIGGARGEERRIDAKKSNLSILMQTHYPIPPTTGEGGGATVGVVNWGRTRSL